MQRSTGMMFSRRISVWWAPSRMMRSRTVPDLHFIEDDSMEYGAKIDSILKTVAEKERGEEQ